MPVDFYGRNRFDDTLNEESGIIDAFNGGWSGKLFIMDLLRSQHRINFYDELLKIKNYVNHNLGYRVQNVIILFNFPPDPDHIDLDKLHVYRCDTTTLYRMTYDNEWLVIGG